MRQLLNRDIKEFIAQTGNHAAGAQGKATGNGMKMSESLVVACSALYRVYLPKDMDAHAENDAVVTRTGARTYMNQLFIHALSTGFGHKTLYRPGIEKSRRVFSITPDKLPSDHATQFASLFFVPVVAGYHLTQTGHVSLSVQMYARTGAYNTSRFANAGQNTWTFTPTLSDTHLVPSDGIELSVNYGINFYTTNNKTDYHNAPLSVLDILALKRFKSGWGVGVIGGWIQQIGDGIGGLADKIGGANGYSVGMGPMVTWSGKFGGTPVSAGLRWVNEFAALNRPKGNAVLLSLSATFE